MNYYQKHIGDFNNKTRHLTRVERSLFSDAIELYYDTEEPLISDLKKMERLLLVHSEEEKSALKVVLDEFFVLTDDGYFNKRCDKEVKKYQAFMESKSKAGKASAEQRANRKATSDKQVKNKRSTSEQLTNYQLPVTNISTTKVVERATRLPKDWKLPLEWQEWAFKEMKDMTLNRLGEIAKKFKDHWLAKAGKDGTKLDLFATWRN